MAVIPPWLNISPQTFLQAIESGTRDGTNLAQMRQQAAYQQAALDSQAADRDSQRSAMSADHQANRDVRLQALLGRSGTQDRTLDLRESELNRRLAKDAIPALPRPVKPGPTEDERIFKLNKSLAPENLRESRLAGLLGLEGGDSPAQVVQDYPALAGDTLLRSRAVRDLAPAKKQLNPLQQRLADIALKLSGSNTNSSRYKITN